MVAATEARQYEECRRKRVEENKRRLEALNLPFLSQALQKHSTPKSSPVKSAKPRLMEKRLVVVRRSGRIAKKPAPVYTEVSIDRPVIPRRVSRSRNPLVHASDKEREGAIGRAEKLLLDLESHHPNFLKSMLPSHVSGGFWLGLPVQFCKDYLPKSDGIMTLLDEDGEEYETIYLSRKTGLSGGWKGFAVAHDLQDGDALVFQLIRSTTFKVYIIRVKSSARGDES